MPPMISSSLGTVVIAGRTYQVTALRLHAGQLHIAAYARGPAPAITDQPATVFGDDGQGVCQSWHVTIRELGRHDDVHVILPMQITHLEVL